MRFDACDKNFVKKFGLIEAANMVLDFSSTHNIPFVYDVWQLSVYLGENPKCLWPIVKHVDDMYKVCLVPKRNGGTRQLCSPNSRLKAIQHNILKKFLNNIPVSRYAMAYIRGKTLSDNAILHVNKKFVLNSFKGLNRSINQNELSHCIFSQDYENIEEQEYINSLDNVSVMQLLTYQTSSNYTLILSFTIFF